MSVVVDTSIWSLALRGNTPNDGNSIVNMLRDLIADGRVVLLGAIRQEVLSGIRYPEQFVKLRDYLWLSKSSIFCSSCILSDSAFSICLSNSNF